ncbi:MAG: hypothetical protein AAB920_01470, partial [Patescibacteria group bacterium]
MKFLFVFYFLVSSFFSVLPYFLFPSLSLAQSVTITAQVNGVCSNGVAEWNEQCDGTDLKSQTCVTRGFSAGTLSCNVNCTFNTSACTSATPASSGGGGGGGGGGVYVAPPQFSQTLSVNISGMAYPVSKVNILLDGAFVASVTADAGALFSKTIEAPVGVRHFGVYSTDIRGRRSLAFTFTLSLNSGTVAAVSGIFLAPIIEVDKSEVRRGDMLTITGQTAPSSTVSIVINSANEIMKDVISDIKGKYTYIFDTSVLELGNHTVKSQAALSDSLISS